MQSSTQSKSKPTSEFLNFQKKNHILSQKFLETNLMMSNP